MAPPEPVTDPLRGLATREARARLARYGPNTLPRARRAGGVRVLARQFRSPLVAVLLAAAAVSAAIGHAEDAAFIGVVLLVNALIGGAQELRAERSSDALQRLLRVRATVVRDGRPIEVDAEQLVPGDVVRLESGVRVPADLRLVSAEALEVDESLLTGESLPVTNEALPPGVNADAPLAERRGAVHAGTTVARGRATGIVTATGAATAVGRLAVDVLSAHGGRPPLLVRMERFARLVALVVLVAAAVIAAIGVLLRGHAPGEMFLFGVALAVSAIPEGLPIALTVALAVASQRMARRGVIVRRLAAVEGLGSCTLIASDKTGTLTCNELTVRVARTAEGAEALVTGEGYAPLGGLDVAPEERARFAPLARAAALCNEGHLARDGAAWSWQGDPTDVALLSFARKAGLDPDAQRRRHPEVARIPFEPEHRYAATFHAAAEPVGSAGAVEVLVKGAPERVLALATLDPEALARHGQEAEALAARGYRVLALARGELAPNAAPDTAEAPRGLELLGFVGMLDPLRPGAPESVARCQAAGVDVAMVTGDHPVTALAIARDLGLAASPDEVVVGPALERLSPAQRAALIGRVRVFARTSPRQKLELVDAARAAGHFVAVTGDGVNDAPALKAAHIGVAMGKSGTDVAREAAELVLTEDDFTALVAGVEEGRIAYDNVRKVVYMQASTGASELLLLGFVLLSGWPTVPATGEAVLPLLPVQILWLNLVTNGIQDVALAFEPGEDDVLRRKPRAPSEPLFERVMVERTLVAAAVMAAVAFGTFYVLVDVLAWSVEASRNGLLLLMVLFQNVHLGNCRSETRSAFARSPFDNPLLLFGTLAALGVHVAAMHTPSLQRVLGVAPVSFATFGVMLALATTVLVAMEAHRVLSRARAVRRHA